LVLLIQHKIKAAFPDYEVRQAFTSRIIIKKLEIRDHLKMDTEKQALDKLMNEGYTEIIIQPLHIEAGDEYEKVSRIVEEFTKRHPFLKISLGRPIFYFTGQNERPDDYMIAIKALTNQIPRMMNHDAIALMGYGGLNPSNTAYAALQMKLQDAELNNVFVFTVEGYPTIDTAIKEMKYNKIKRVTLMPLMLTAGDHANKGMAGDGKDSFKSQLIAAGFQVNTYVHGLGENTKIQDIYVQHVQDAMDGRYDKSVRGSDRPIIPVIE
jgi:sirohydrochlorin cobaltochelatase